MKELSIKEKAKAYDEAIERANDILKGYDPKEGSKATINYIFPGLAESEDKRIRKVLIEGFKRYDDEFLFNGCLVKEILSWLEEQKDYIKLPNSAYTSNRDVIEFADEYSHTVWEKLMNKFKENENYNIGCNDVSDIVLNAIINTYNWLEKQGKQSEKEFTFKSIPRLLEMIEPTDRAKSYCQKLIDSLVKEGYITDAKIVKEVFKGWNGEDVPMAVMDEQKPYGQREECLDCQFNYAGECKGSCAMKRNEQNPINKEPKFRVGNWYQCTKDFFGKGVTFDKNTTYYCAEEGCLQDEYGCHIAIVKDLYDNFKLWTIQDAKDGDVLAEDPIEGHLDIYPSSFVAIYKKQNGEDFDSYCFVGFDGKFYKGENGHSTEDIHPATKEQRDILFQKMHEAGYTFDFKKKELKKLKFKVGDEIITENEESLTITRIDEEGYWSNDLFICSFDDSAEWKLVEQKPEWSKDDEEMIGCLNNCLDELEKENGWNYVYINGKSVKLGKIRNWIKSLKPQLKQEWSKEDERRLKSCLSILQPKTLLGNIETINTKWLKSLKDRVQSQNLTITDEELAQAKKDAYNEVLDKTEYNSDWPTFDDGWSAAIWYLKKRNAIPQNTWKPDKKQMYFLNWLANVKLGDSVVEQEVSKNLNELYNDLTKL